MKTRPFSAKPVQIATTKPVSKPKLRFEERISEHETRADTKMSVATLKYDTLKKERVKSLKQDVKKEAHIKKVLLKELENLQKSIKIYEKQSRTTKKAQSQK